MRRLAIAAAIIGGVAAAVLNASVTAQIGHPVSDRQTDAGVEDRRTAARASSIEFRSGSDEDALACAHWKASDEPFDASPIGLSCAGEHLNRLCAAGRDRVVPRFADFLGTSTLYVVRALSRYNIVNEERNESLCDVGGGGQRQLITFAGRSNKSPSGSKLTEKNPHRMLRSITNSDGTIDAGAYARAIDERFAIVEATDSDPTALAGLPMTTAIDDPLAPGLKTGGLPTDPGAWTNLTGYVHPVGRINDLLIDPSGSPDTRTMWAGTDGGGIWKSTDSGSSWTRVSDRLGSLVIGKIVRSAIDPQVMYASTNPIGSHGFSPYGIIKSTDGGVTWAQLAQTNPGTNADFVHVSHLAIHPMGVAGHDVLLAATNRDVYDSGTGQFQGGIYQSLDSGATWTKISAAIAGSFVMFHPSNGDRRAYALMNGSVFVTDNGTFGAAPTSSVVTNTYNAHLKLAWAASDPNVMYALAKFEFSFSQHVTRLYRSANAGSAWSQLAMSTGIYSTGRSLSHYTGAVWVDPTSPNRIAVGELWAGSTANATTANASAGWRTSVTGWADFHGIVHDPGYNGGTNKIVYMMDDGGLYRHTDVDAIDSFPNGSILATGMTISEVYSVAGRGGNLIFGAQDVNARVYRSAVPVDPAARWRSISGMPNGDGSFTAASRTNPNVLFGSRQYLDLYRSDDGGVTATSICGTSPTRITEGRCGSNFDAQFIAPFVLDPGNGNTVWAGALSLWRTLDATASPPSWIKAHTLSFLNYVTAVAVAPSDPNVVWVAYAGFGSDLFKSVNATANPPALAFTLVPATGLPPNQTVTRIMIDRTNAQRVWVALEGSGSPRLYVSNNGGATFSAITGLPQTTVFALAQHPSNPAWLYAGTLVGLFASQNFGQSWGANNEGPANVTVRDLNWYSESGQSAELLVATFGRGVWRATVEATTPSLSVARPGSGYGTVSGLAWGIDCGSDCTEMYGEPTTMTLTAAAAPGSVFTGWLGGCTGTTLNCDITVSGATSVSATFAQGSTIPKVDVDANNPVKYDALTDGLMILRYLFNLATVTAGALGPDATRTTDAAIAQHLTDVKPLLDVDGNGQADALTDGLMILRYLFQLRGSTLTNNAIGNGARRTTATQTENYLASVLQ